MPSGLSLPLAFGIYTRLIVLLRYKFRTGTNLLYGAAQQGQRDKPLARATAIRLCTLAIEFATWRSGRIGGASGSITFGNGRFLEPRGGGRF